MAIDAGDGSADPHEHLAVALAELARAHAMADQNASDVDARASDADRVASAQDQSASARDQAASDADQAVSDREFGDGVSPTAARRAAHDAARNLREDGTLLRQRSSRGRGDADLSRMRQGVDRFATAALRDELAAERDRDAELRDARVERAELMLREADPANEVLRGVLEANAVGRGQARRDRERAAADREQAANDRVQAADERRVAGLAIREAQLDDLTGVLARGLGLRTLQNEIDRCRREGKPFVLAFVDIDHLKVVNDLHGHAHGDALIRAVVVAIRSKLRSYDLIARIGGDEFLCGLPGSDLQGAFRRTESIRRAVASGAVAGSVSIGVAELEPDDSIESLMSRADRAMYRRK